MPAKLHFAENAFALHLLLERLQRLINVVVANENLHGAAISFDISMKTVKQSDSTARERGLYHPVRLTRNVPRKPWQLSRGLTDLRLMAILKIARMGHPILLRRADPVSDPRDPNILRLIDDMIETMEDAGGAGLAAPQVHVPLRLFVYRVPDDRASGDDDPPRDTAALVNPVIEPDTDEIVNAYEGCLSIPDLRGLVPRPARIRYRGIDGQGRAVDGIATGFHALVLQHEYDHLDGILYVSRMTDLSKLSYLEEHRRFPLHPVELQT